LDLGVRDGGRERIGVAHVVRRAAHRLTNAVLAGDLLPVVRLAELVAELLVLRGVVVAGEGDGDDYRVREGAAAVVDELGHVGLEGGVGRARRAVIDGAGVRGATGIRCVVDRGGARVGRGRRGARVRRIGRGARAVVAGRIGTDAPSAGGDHADEA